VHPEGDGVLGERTAAVPRTFHVQRRPAGAVEHRHAPNGAEGRIRGRCARRRALLIGVEPIQRPYHLHVPVALRIAANRQTVSRVLLGQIIKPARERGLAGIRRLASRGARDVGVDAGIGVVLPEAERVRRLHHRREIVGQLHLGVGHAGVQQSRCAEHVGGCSELVLRGEATGRTRGECCARDVRQRLAMAVLIIPARPE
jgi:hypothetical protein